MAVTACILINEWRPVILKTLEACQNCCSEILLGANGDFNPEGYPHLNKLEKTKIIFLEWEGYGETKNNLAALAENDWILSLDADEIPDEKLQAEIKKINTTPPDSRSVYAFGMYHYFGETLVRHGAWSIGKKSFNRLYNRKYTHWDHASVHETLVIPQGGKILRLEGHVHHFTVDDYQHFLEKSHRYARLSVKKYRQQGKHSFIGKSWLGAGYTLIKDYIFRLGFLDKNVGWKIAKGNALYVFWKYHWLRRPLPKRK